MEQFLVVKDALPLAQFEAETIEAAIERFTNEFQHKELIFRCRKGEVAFFDTKSKGNFYMVFPRRLENR